MNTPEFKLVIFEILEGDLETVFSPVVPDVGDWITSKMLKQVSKKHTGFEDNDIYRVSNREFVFADSGQLKHIMVYAQLDGDYQRERNSST